MKPEELRIGNWVKHDKSVRGFSGTLTQISPIDFEDVSIYKPIPLTEEWLLKFGFTPLQGVYYNEIMMFKSTNASRNEWVLALYPKEVGSASYPMAQRFYFVHQLQNLYYALIGEELTIEQ